VVRDEPVRHSGAARDLAGGDLVVRALGEQCGGGVDEERAAVGPGHRRLLTVLTRRRGRA
jgi:hypothetical protein